MGGVILPEDQIRCGVAGLWDRIPHQDPVVPRVGDNQSPILHEDAGGQIHAPLRSATTGRAALSTAVPLAENDIGRVLVVVGNAVPNQHPMVAGIGDHQVILAEEDSPRRIHPRHRRARRRQSETAGCGRPEPDVW